MRTSVRGKRKMDYGLWNAPVRTVPYLPPWQTQTVTRRSRQIKRDKETKWITCLRYTWCNPRRGTHWPPTKIWVEMPQDIQKIATPSRHCPRKPAPTHLLTSEYWNKDLLPSTLLTGTVSDLPWATTCSNTHFYLTTRRVHKTLLKYFPDWNNKPLSRQPLHILCNGANKRTLGRPKINSLIC